MGWMIGQKHLNVRYCVDMSENNFGLPYLHKLPETKIKEQATTVRPGPSAHLSNFQVRHLADNLQKSAAAAKL